MWGGSKLATFTNNRWYTQLDRHWFVYDTWDNGSRLGLVMVECTLSITRCLRLNLQLHTIDLVRTCRISSFCTVVWQLARFQLARRIARSLGDSWASCSTARCCAYLTKSKLRISYFCDEILLAPAGACDEIFVVHSFLTGAGNKNLWPRCHNDSRTKGQPDTKATGQKATASRGVFSGAYLNTFEKAILS